MNAFIQKSLIKVFGSRNDRLLKRYRRIVTDINALEPEIIKLSDDELRDRAQGLHADMRAGKTTLDAHLADALAIIRESMDRNIGMRSIYNPEEKFDPEMFKGKESFNAYCDGEDDVIQKGVPWNRVRRERERE